MLLPPAPFPFPAVLLMAALPTFGLTATEIAESFGLQSFAGLETRLNRWLSQHAAELDARLRALGSSATDESLVTTSAIYLLCQRYLEERTAADMARWLR